MVLKIYEWMVTDLKLTKNELLVFAVIYNYRRGEWFNVPKRIISDWAGITPRGISRIIQRLSELCFIEYKVLIDDEVGCYSVYKISETILEKYKD